MCLAGGRGQVRVDKLELGILSDWSGGQIWLSLVGFKLEAGTKLREGCQLLIKPWPFGANCYKSYYLASWFAARDSNLASCKSDLQEAGFLGWLLWKSGWCPGQVAAGCGAELYCYGWPGHRLCVHSVSPIPFLNREQKEKLSRHTQKMLARD